jgi:hypothetical protein
MIWRWPGACRGAGAAGGWVGMAPPSRSGGRGGRGAGQGERPAATTAGPAREARSVGAVAGRGQRRVGGVAAGPARPHGWPGGGDSVTVTLKALQRHGTPPRWAEPSPARRLLRHRLPRAPVGGAPGRWLLGLVGQHPPMVGQRLLGNFIRNAAGVHHIPVATDGRGLSGGRTSTPPDPWPARGVGHRRRAHWGAGPSTGGAIGGR